MSQAVERLARRVGDDPFFLAAPLAQYAQAEGLGDAELAVRLGCDPAILTDLRLCRSPDPQPPSFWNDVQVIAGRFGISPDTLAEIVRYGQNLASPAVKAKTSQNQGPVDLTGFLLAARDRKPDEGNQAEEGETPGGPKSGS